MLCYIMKAQHILWLWSKNTCVTTTLMQMKINTNVAVSAIQNCLRYRHTSAQLENKMITVFCFCRISSTHSSSELHQLPLIEWDVAANLIKNSEFQANSFPSHRFKYPASRFAVSLVYETRWKLFCLWIFFSFLFGSYFFFFKKSIHLHTSFNFC